MCFPLIKIIFLLLFGNDGRFVCWWLNLTPYNNNRGQGAHGYYQLRAALLNKPEQIRRWCAYTVQIDMSCAQIWPQPFSFFKLMTFIENKWKLLQTFVLFRFCYREWISRFPCRVIDFPSLSLSLSLVFILFRLSVMCTCKCSHRRGRFSFWLFCVKLVEPPNTWAYMCNYCCTRDKLQYTLERETHLLNRFTSYPNFWEPVKWPSRPKVGWNNSWAAHTKRMRERERANAINLNEKSIRTQVSP